MKSSLGIKGWTRLSTPFLFLPERSFWNGGHYFLESLKLRGEIRALELGGGTGRATKVFVDTVKKFRALDVVDMSLEMVSCLSRKFEGDKRISVKKSDNIDYLKKTRVKYDIVYSLWSFSHSVHQHMVDEGLRRGSRYVEQSLRKFCRTNLNPQGNFFITHFDSLSEEQKILMKQWARDFHIFRKRSQQSPSKLLLDKVLKNLDSIIYKRTVKHYVGDQISYCSLDELLEIFLNFHMETEYNRNRRLRRVLDDISRDVRKYRKPNGTYLIRPGCFVYSFQKRIAQ